MIVTLFRLFALLLSFLGYFSYVCKKGVHIAFAPVLTVSSIGLVMFGAGLLNIMPLAAYSIFLGGIGLFLSALFRRKAYIPHFPCSTLVFYVISFALISLRVRGALPTHSDNFTHWLTVIIDMLKNNRLPNSRSKLIFFQSYPTGSAGFIYYVCKILGSAESIILLGQGIMLISCLCVFWAFIEKPNWKSSIFIIGISLYMLAANNVITDVLVDSLLAFIAVSMFGVLS